MKRISISKSLRFKIFKRDEFSCQYCGRTPELHSVTLEVDHKISVKDGGGNEEENLTTSCFDCNRGKSKTSVIKGSLENTKNQLEEIKERLEQVKYISKLKDKIKNKKQEIKENKFNFINDIMNGYSEEFIHLVKTRIKNQHNKHGYSLELLQECLEITEDKFRFNEKFYTKHYLMYFHGVLNNRLKESTDFKF